MSTTQGVDRLPPGLRFVATVGVFDGLHRGHLAVIRTTRETARRLDAVPVAITFEPHPEVVLRGTTPLLLCDPAQRLTLLEAAIDGIVVVQPFDRAFSLQSAEAFVERLAHQRDLAALVMSAESAFGHDREGTATTLRRLADRGGWELVEVPTLELGGVRVSSGRIRALIEAGRLAAARSLLTRRYAVTGEVVHGDHRGRTLGFPTANLRFDPPVCLPRDGIYAVHVSWGGKGSAHGRTAEGVASLGIRPTFGGGARLLEVHLLDFDGDLYGQLLRVEFVRRQRGEKRFRSADELVSQMRRDAARAREILATA